MKAGALMLDLDGLVLTDDERELLVQPEVGGLILFGRNIENYDQLKALIADIRTVAPDILIAIDQEGGRVQRLKDGVALLPPMSVLGEMADRQEAIKAARQLGLLMAWEMRELDIDISFAPVLDLDFGRSGVIGNRAFGFRRFNRQGDFRASGSGHLDWDPKQVDPAFVRLAFAIADAVKVDL